MQILPEASGASSSHANIVHSDDENVKECQEGSCEVVFRDLEAGLPIDSSASVDEEVMHNVNLLEDCMTSRPLVATTYDAISVETLDQHPPCDVKALVDYELRQPLLAFVHTDDTKDSQDEEVLLNAQTKLGSDSLEQEVYVQGLSGHCGSQEDAITSFGKVSGVGRMPEEEQRGGVSSGTGQESKQKAVEKKAGKQGKAQVRPSAVRRASDSAELWAKEDAETNRKDLHESLDNFIRQTIRCEPYMNFMTRSGDKPLQRLRPEVFESHVAGKFSKSFKVDNGSGPSDTGTEANHGIESHASDMDNVKDGINSSSKDITGLGRVSQHSLKVPPGVVAFTQAAAKGSDLQGWLSPSKVNLIKCEKCAREFCATLNYRRHVRVHRRSLNAEKEDLSKERSKVAAFWDKLSPEEARSIVCCENMEVEDLSGLSALKALINFIQQPGLPLLPQHILKAGAGLLDIVQSKASAFPLSSNRLLNMLDDASEKTFLCGGTSVAVQRFVFNGEAGKAGLEEKNLVASMGFHIELKLVKAWMADKEAEALRCQQALFKEEEAAQQKREKLLEKKRMKKIRQKERKGGSPQLVLQKSDNESLDDEAITQGIVDEDDSPSATGSSACSLSSAQDLALADTMELDVSEDVTRVDAQEEHLLGLGHELLSGKKRIGGADQSHLLAHQFADHKSERLGKISSQEATTRLDRKEQKEAAEVDKEVCPPLRHTNEEPGESDGDVRALQTSARSRSWRAGDVHSSSYFRKVEQERIGPDLRRLDSDRFAPERKSSRNTWDRSRNDYSESSQKLGRDFRGFDGKYGDVVPHGFKSVRNTNAYFVKGDGGASDLPNLSRLQQYRSKPSGIRMMSTAGNGQVVWTRKFPQAPPVEAVISRRVDEIEDDAGASKVVGAVGGELNEASKEVVSNVLNSGNGAFETKPEEKEKESLTTPFSTDTRFAGSESVVVSPGKILEADEEGSTGGFRVGSLSVPLGKFANANVSQSRSGSYSQPVHPQVPRVPTVHTTALSHEMQGLCICTQEGGRAPGIHSWTGDDEAYEASKNATAMVKADSDTSQLGVLKPQLSILSPENGKGCVSVTATPVGQERPTAKQMPWQTSAGRYVSSKVWRPVCTAGERHDSMSSGLHGTNGDRDSNGSDKRPFQDGRTSGRKESEIGNSPSIDAEQERPIGSQFSKAERHCWNDDGLIVVNSSIGVNCNDVCVPSAPLTSIMSVGSDCLSDGQVESSMKGLSDNGAQYADLASGLCSLSSFVEVARVLFNERWRLALAQATGDEKVAIAADSPTDGFSNDTAGLNFLEMVFVQLADQSSRQHPGAGSLLSPSSSTVTESSIDVAKGGDFSCRTFSDSDLTGGDDTSPLSLSKTDKLGLHGAGTQVSRIPASIPLQDATRMGENSLSPVESEQSVFGSETNSSHMTSSSIVGRVGHNRSEARVDTCGTGALHARRERKQTMGNRHLRDGLLEQRYVARRRAPSHKNC